MAGSTWQNNGITSASHIYWPGDGGTAYIGDNIRSEMKMTSGDDGESCTLSGPSKAGQSLFLFLGGSATVVVNFQSVINASDHTAATFTSGDFLLLVSVVKADRIAYWQVVVNSGVATA